MRGLARFLLSVFVVVFLFGGGIFLAGGVDGADPPTAKRDLRVSQVEGYRRAVPPALEEEAALRAVIESAARKPIELGDGDASPTSYRQTCTIIPNRETQSLTSMCDARSELIFDSLDLGTSDNIETTHRVMLGDSCCVCTMHCFGGTGTVCWTDCRCSESGFYAPGC